MSTSTSVSRNSIMRQRSPRRRRSRCSRNCEFKAPEDPDYNPAGTYPDSHLSLHWHCRLQPFRRDTTSTMAAKHSRSLPQYRRCIDQLFGATRCHQAQRGISIVSPGALFDKLGIRTMVIETDPFENFLGQGYGWGLAETGPVSATSICKTALERSRRLCQIREHGRTCLGSGWPPGLWGILLDQRYGHVPSATGCLLHARCRRSNHSDHSIIRSGRELSPNLGDGRGQAAAA
jgi:hypothetical protein